MALTNNFRRSFPRNMDQKFDIYWHAMHPVDFNIPQLYRAGFNNKEWKALKLLMDRRADCVSGGYNFQVKDKENGWRMTFDLPKKYKDYPSISVQANAGDLKTEVRDHLTKWCETYMDYQDLQRKMHSYLYEIMQVDGDHRSTIGLNTERQLYAFWPELLPFLSQDIRHTIRNTKVKPRMPSHWDESWVTGFFERERMEDINYALQVIQLLPQKKDPHYPQVY